jgi:hypothetical protein
VNRRVKTGNHFPAQFTHPDNERATTEDDLKKHGIVSNDLPDVFDSMQNLFVRKFTDENFIIDKATGLRKCFNSSVLWHGLNCFP